MAEITASRKTGLNGAAWLWLLLGALLARLPGLAGSLWYDEAFTLWLAGLPFRNMIAATAGDVHPPLWYIISWLSVRVFGLTELALRLPALALGLLAIWQTRRVLARLNLPESVQILGVWLAALSPMLVYYSGEGRMYALLLCLVLWAAESALAGRWLQLALAMALGLYTHNLMALYLPGLLIIAAGGGRREAAGKAAALAGLLYTPWLPVLLKQFLNVQRAYWILPLTPGRIVYTLYVLLAGPGPHEAILLITAPLLLGLLLAGLMLAWQFRAFTWPLLTLALLPPALGAAVSLVTPILLPRALIGSAPFLLALLAWPQKIILKRLGAWSLLPLAGSLAVALVLLYAHPPRTDLRGKYAQVAVSPGDTCYHLNASSMVAGRYALPLCRHVIWPDETDLEHSLTSATKTAMGMAQLPIEALAGPVWLFHYAGPHTTPRELAERERILKGYPVLSALVLSEHPIAATRAWKLDAGGRAHVAGRATQ